MSVQSSPKWENLFPIIIVTNAESTSNNFLFKHIPHWAGSSLIFVTMKGRSPNPCSCLNFSMSSTSLLGSKHNFDIILIELTRNLYPLYHIDDLFIEIMNPTEKLLHHISWSHDMTMSHVTPGHIMSHDIPGWETVSRGE